MELPIQLKFFKKIELYQEYKFQEKKAAKTGLQAWNIEKCILKWTTNNHHHLGSPLTPERIKKDMLPENQSSSGLNHALENLIQRGYAIEDQQGIRTTKEGLLMGEVINDIGGRSSNKYQAFYIFVWVVTVCGTFIVLINAILLLFKFFKLFFCYA